MKYSAGSLESSDCMITVSKHEIRQIDIDSTVFEQFGDDILNVITKVLDELEMHHIKVECVDKGAFDYTIKSRLITALQRGEFYE